MRGDVRRLGCADGGNIDGRKEEGGGNVWVGVGGGGGLRAGGEFKWKGSMWAQTRAHEFGKRAAVRMDGSREFLFDASETLLLRVADGATPAAW